MDFLFLLLHEFINSETNRRRLQALKEDAVAPIKTQLEIATAAGDDEQEAKLLIDLGNVYAYFSELSLSDTMYRQALAIARQISDTNLEIVALLNLGLSYKFRTDYPQAYLYYQKALKIAREIGDDELKRKIYEHIDELGNLMNLETLSKE